MTFPPDGKGTIAEGYFGNELFVPECLLSLRNDQVFKLDVGLLLLGQFLDEVSLQSLDIVGNLKIPQKLDSGILRRSQNALHRRNLDGRPVQYD